jgi:signal peptide peptidase SppA
MSGRYSRTLQAIREHPWAIVPSALELILEIVEFRAAGGRFDAAEIQARVGEKDDDGQSPSRVGPVAVLPLHGVMAPRMNLFMQISGGVSTELFGKMFDDALAESEVHAIVLSVDSPGGSVFGVEELSQKIYRARGKKPIVAVADHMAASAAYQVAAQAHELVVSPSGMVGSIGVVTTHTDVSKAQESRGVKTTLVAIPAAKVAGHPYEPLSDESRGEIHARIAPYYELFVKAVARGRGVSVKDVKDGYGQGRVLSAIPARDAAMVDRIESLSDVIARLSTPQGRRAVMTARTPGGTETTAQEPSPATAQESRPAPWRDVLQVELDTL